MQFARLAAAFDKLEGTTKRLERVAILVDLLGDVPASDMEATARLAQGKVRPDWEGVELGLAEKMILRVLSTAAGRDVTAAYQESGDLGEVAQLAVKGAGSSQATLFGPEPLTVADAYARLLEIAHVEGAGSQDKKQKLLAKLLSDAEPLEARYLVRMVAGRLRLGVADMTFLDALAALHLGRGVRSVVEMEEDERAEHEDVRRRLERAYDERSDLALVAATLAADGLEGVDGLGSELGVPLRAMAAERLKTIPEILEKHEGRSAMEYKYDGLRLQCHVGPDGVRLFSRRMEELTDQFPDVQAHLAAALRGASVIVEGECVAVDADGKMRPFQDVSRRRGRKTGLGEDARQEAALSEGGAAAATVMDEIPVAVFLFDCFAAEGESTMPLPYLERRARLEAAFAFDDHVQLADMEVCEDEAAMEAFFARAVADGAEGVMCKSLGGPYKAGNRGYDWIKFKTDYTEDLVDTMDLVAIGAFHGRGRRAGWYGALLMAAYDPDAGRWASLCKLGTGFDDETLKGLKERFADHVAPQRPDAVDTEMEPDIWFRPAIVMEVQAAELTVSPTHKAGWSLIRKDAGIAARFPRFSGRWRDDKAPEQATTVGEVVSLYEAQPEIRRVQG
ncbi:MAG: ATP-dependent DNA ligase [Thermoplasmatota archaeon]